MAVFFIDLKFVYPDDYSLAALDLLLVFIGRIFDLALNETVFDGGNDPARLVDRPRQPIAVTPLLVAVLILIAVSSGLVEKKSKPIIGENIKFVTYQPHCIELPSQPTSAAKPL